MPKLPFIKSCAHSKCIILIATKTPVFYLEQDEEHTMPPVSREFKEGENLFLVRISDYLKTFKWHPNVIDSPIGQMVRTAVELGNIDYLEFSRKQAEIVIDYCDGNQELIEKFEAGYFKQKILGLNIPNEAT